MSLRKRVSKSIAVFDALWARVSSWHRNAQTLLLLRTVWRGLWQILQNRTSLRRSVSCDICEVRRGLKLQVQNRACSTLTVFTDSDWAGDRSTRKSVSSWVIMLDGFLINAGARTQSVIAQSSCGAEYIAASAATSEAKYIQALFLACGQHVNIHLRSDSSGATGVASRRCLQRLRHLDVRFLWLQAETASKNIRISKVLAPENVADADTKPADKRSIEFCRSKMASQRSRNSSVMQFCNKFITIFLSVCHHS